MSEHNHTTAGESTRPNKSALKRARQALQKLACELVELRPAQLEKIPLDETLALAVIAARSMQKNALKRQIRYLAGLLAKRDPLPLQQALEDLRGGSHTATARLHRAERWRDRLLEEGDEALGALAVDYPHVEYSHLRMLIRGTLREREQGRPARKFRELYRYLHGLDLDLDAVEP